MSRSRRPRPPVLAAVAFAALGLAACDKLPGASTESSTPAAAPASSAAAPAASSAASGKASAKPSGSVQAAGLPDICTLLTKAEVGSLTGEQVTLMTDEGGNSPNARYCQWQLSQGQLTVTVNVEDRDNFEIQHKDAKKVVGLGDSAYSLSGHLYVWEDGRDVDVYVSSESSDAANLNVARQTAQKVLPRLAAKK
ncbi:hypothetical protein ACFFX1_17740 [Dactylosporangium sucinum]|uniref:DUF3558 domain-containing protein n=1 Tax=Dactylosporangium sucinum TaxID=1424081 RepID=A0A917WXW0_9ACTN|nr:hypothetical protein [Dactylosporangium sucinum]GGM40304.1 hypothetical protein GCM10007977_047110 [Dactylosporangium sucinum]